MHRIAAVVLVVAGAALASAQDGAGGAPLPPPAEKPPTASPTPALSDADRAFLVRAAERQGGGELADGVRSLQLHFGRVRGWRPTRQADGVTLRKEFATDRAAFAWQRHDDGAASFIEHVSMNGKATSRCIYAPRKSAWMWADGDPAVTMLNEDSHAEDFAQLRERRRMIGTLADLLVLRNALHDGSTWMRIDDRTHAGRAFLRRPHTSAIGAVPFKVWIHEETLDLVAVRIPSPTEDGHPQDLRFVYSARLPRVHGATMRVPMAIKTHDLDPARPTAPRADDATPRLEMYIVDIEFARLPNSVFAPRAPAAARERDE